MGVAGFNKTLIGCWHLDVMEFSLIMCAPLLIFLFQALKSVKTIVKLTSSENKVVGYTWLWA